MRDICPHRGMPLSFGHFDGERVDVPIMDGNLIQAVAVVTSRLLSRIGASTRENRITSYPCQEEDGYVWSIYPIRNGWMGRCLNFPRLPLPSTPYRMVHISTVLDCTIDDGIVGLMDPATALSSIKALGGELKPACTTRQRPSRPFPTVSDGAPRPPKQRTL